MPSRPVFSGGKSEFRRCHLELFNHDRRGLTSLEFALAGRGKALPFGRYAQPQLGAA
jgi:hypothetical protein